MNIMVRLAVFFYMTLVMVLACLLELFVLNIIAYQDIVRIFYLMHSEPRMRLAFGAAAAGLLVLNYVFSRAILGIQQREKTIAFDNPAGRVSVSLTAMDDLIRRAISRVPEVKEVRSAISAGKKGLTINSRLVLNADVNIPEITSRVQDLVKQKIHDTIGIEDTVIVRVHVTKIIPEGGKSKRPKDNDPLLEGKAAEPNVPFQGYRA